MKLLYIFAVLCLTQTSYAQSIERQVIGSCGSTTSNGINHSFTVGETFVSTYDSFSPRVYEGFQQATDTSNFISIMELEKNLTLNLYPNPTEGKSILNITLKEYQSTFKIGVFSIAGKEVYTSKISNFSNGKSETIIDLTSFSKGMYFVNILTSNGFSKTFKLIKN